MSKLLKWPLPALWVWGGAWVIYLNLSGLMPDVWAMVFACAVGVAFSVMGSTRARQWALALGFPLSLWASGLASVPAWGWLLPLALALFIYPVHAWRDAPIFPTPLNALQDLPGVAPLPIGAQVLDAGCGLGDGLKALRCFYPQSTGGIHATRYAAAAIAQDQWNYYKTNYQPVETLRIKRAVEAGELDTQIETASNKLREGFSK